MLLEASMQNSLETFMQWGFVGIIVFVLLIIFAKWGLKKSFPTMVSLFYFLIPTYIMNSVVVLALGTEVLNKYSVLPLPEMAFFLCPPLVWDSLFAMGVKENRSDLIFISVAFILFLPLWVALKTSAGIDQEKTKKHYRLKKFVSAWIIVTILGLGLSNFYFFVISILSTTEVLGLNLIFWIAIAGGIVLVVAYLKKRKKNKAEYWNNPNCELIDGEWVCKNE